MRITDSPYLLGVSIFTAPEGGLFVYFGGDKRCVTGDGEGKRREGNAGSEREGESEKREDGTRERDTEKGRGRTGKGEGGFRKDSEVK